MYLINVFNIVFIYLGVTQATQGSGFSGLRYRFGTDKKSVLNPSNP